MFVIRLIPDSAQDQVNWITVGTLAFVAFAWLGRRYQLMRRYTYTAGAAALVILVITGLFGTTINGARLWIVVGGQTVQTTELIKLFVVVFLAGYLAERGTVLATPTLKFGGRTYSSLPYLVPLLGLLFAAIAALALLKDLGSIALLVLLAVSLLYVATGRARYLVWGLALLAVTGLAGYLAFDHAELRIDTWLNPDDDPGGTGYQAMQATYAIQAGGITGEGLGLGQPESIPAAATDYIFSAVAEELGLAGAIGVVLLYLLLLFGPPAIAYRAPATYVYSSAGSACSCIRQRLSSRGSAALTPRESPCRYSYEGPSSLGLRLLAARGTPAAVTSERGTLLPEAPLPSAQHTPFRIAAAVRTCHSCCRYRVHFHRGARSMMRACRDRGSGNEIPYRPIATMTIARLVRTANLGDSGSPGFLTKPPPCERCRLSGRRSCLSAAALIAIHATNGRSANQSRARTSSS